MNNTINNISVDNKIDSYHQYSKVVISRFSEDDYGYIISIRNDIIYIFDWEGNFLLKTNIDSSGKYYSIVPINGNDNECTFMLGIVNSNSILNFIFFTYFKNRTIIRKYSNDIITNQVKENGLSCQLMSNLTQGDTIVCFCIFKDSIIYITPLFIDPVSHVVKINNLKKYIQSDSVKAIKSSVTFNKDYSLVCFNLKNDNSAYTIYSVKNNSFSQEVYFDFQCGQEPYSINVYYIRETRQYTFICIYQNSINVGLFYNNLTFVDKYNINIQEDIKGFGIIFSYQLKNYYLISGTEKGNIFTHLSSNISISNIYGPINITEYFIETNIESITTQSETSEPNNSQSKTSKPIIHKIYKLPFLIYYLLIQLILFLINLILKK